jgi:hypothetical protein
MSPEAPRKPLCRLPWISGGIGLVALVLLLVNLFWLFSVRHQSSRFFWNLTLSNGAIWYGWAVGDSPEPAGGFAFSRGAHDRDDLEFTPLVWVPRWIAKPANGVIVFPLWVFSLAAIGGGATLCWRGCAQRQRKAPSPPDQ